MANNRNTLGDPTEPRIVSFLWSSDRKIEGVYRYKANAILDIKPALTSASALLISVS
jgi:hypothetical protein